MRVPKRLVELKQRVEPTVKTFEWTWTTAVVFCVGLWFFILIFAVVVPSFWMYFAEQKLGWGGPTDIEAFLKKPFSPGFPHLSKDTYLQIRDAVAMGLTTGPIVTILVVAGAMQNWRKKLRGGGSGTRPTGGYR